MSGDEQDDAFARAWDQREMRDLTDDLRPIFSRYGHGKVQPPKGAAAESRRVKAMIERDRADRNREAYRQQAEMEVSENVFVNLSGTVVEPTPEWMDKGEVQTFRPKQPDGTVREIKSVRRVLTPIVVRLWTKGRLTHDQARACIWYRQTAMVAGVIGRFSSSRYGMAATLAATSPSRTLSAAGHTPLTLEEAEARRALRAARAAIAQAYLRFFDAVVIDDVVVRRAARLARCRNGRAEFHLRQCAQDLANHCDAEKVDLGRFDI